MTMRVKELFDTLPPIWSNDPFPQIQELVKNLGKKIIVLDDDPTGTQTVHGVPVLTTWSCDTLIDVFREPGEIVYILTNSRSFDLQLAKYVNQEVAKNLISASQITGRDFVIVSRSDSTLRGHYPGELVSLIETLDRKIDGILIIPFFREGGRITINNIHYLMEAQKLIPVAETEFSIDPVFGYKNSNLIEWVCEKHEGRITPSMVASISIDDERLKGPDWIAEKLINLNNTDICVVNASEYRDLEVFVAGLLKAELSGKSFIYRTAASFVRVRGGLLPRQLLTSSDLGPQIGMKGGLIVAGSYKKKSTLQIEEVKRLSGVIWIEVDVNKLLDPANQRFEINRVSKELNKLIRDGVHALVYTSRQFLSRGTKSTSIEISQKISDALVKIIQNLDEKPSWIIAKGGITSSDIATKGLNVKRAEVLGQAIPGVPVWRLGSSSKWPGLIYVVFPGNVGDNNSIAEMVNILVGRKEKYSIRK
jgi:uncharacterized protein YgbK (DUF1537 family)